MNQRMPLLQRKHFAVAVLVHLVDAFRRRLGRHHGRDVGHPVLDGALPQVAVVMGCGLAGRRVHDQLDLTVNDPALDVGLAFVNLVDLLYRDACRGNELRRPFRGDDLEAVV